MTEKIKLFSPISGITCNIIIEDVSGLGVDVTDDIIQGSTHHSGVLYECLIVYLSFVICLSHA